MSGNRSGNNNFLPGVSFPLPLLPQISGPIVPVYIDDGAVERLPRPPPVTTLRESSSSSSSEEDAPISVSVRQKRLDDIRKKRMVAAAKAQPKKRRRKKRKKEESSDEDEPICKSVALKNQAPQWQRPRRKRAPFELLPLQLKLRISSYLCPEAIVKIGLASRRLNRFINTSSLWEILCKRIWEGECPPNCRRIHDWKATFKKRMRNFSKGKVYLCGFCTCHYAFSKRVTYLDHIKLHKLDPTTDREYLLRHACPVEGCKCAYDFAATLQAHMRRVHGMYEKVEAIPVKKTSRVSKAEVKERTGAPGATTTNTTNPNILLL